MRRDFSRKVKLAAFARAAGRCEMCSGPLSVGHFDYDHRVPDALGGDPTLDNCVVACSACHDGKTAKVDLPTIARAKRREASHLGARAAPKRPIRSAGFPASAKRAANPMPGLPRRALYGEVS